MILIALLFAALLQYLFPSLRWDGAIWFRAYRERMQVWMGNAALNSWLSFVLFCLPIWVLALILLAVIHWLLGSVAYIILVCLVGWLALDIYPVRASSPTDETWLAHKLRAVFSPLFWFALLGVPLLLLQYVIRLASTSAPARATGASCDVDPASRVLAILDWLPARLLLLSCAVVGDFTVTMREAASYWGRGLSSSASNLYRCVQASVRESSVSLTGELVSESAFFAQYRRALIVWAVIIGVFTIGYWVAI